MQQHLRSNRDGVHNYLSNMLTTICRSWFKKRPNSAKDFVFVSERGSPLTRQSAWRIVAEAGNLAGLDVHPQHAQHSCGYFLANKGLDTRLIQDYMGHKHIQNKVRLRKSMQNGLRLWR